MRKLQKVLKLEILDMIGQTGAPDRDENRLEVPKTIFIAKLKVDDTVPLRILA